MFIAALLIVAKNWKQLKHFSIDKFWYIWNVEYSFRNKDDSIITTHNISKKSDIKNMILFIKLKNRHH